jgi:hypothetical protein
MLGHRPIGACTRAGEGENQSMRYSLPVRSILALSVLALAACTPAENAPISGTSPGSAAPAARVAVEAQPHSAPVSAGTAVITGTSSTGRPIIERTGTASGDIGGTTPQPKTTSRGN